jgi:hypothetical protein
LENEKLKWMVDIKKSMISKYFYEIINPGDIGFLRNQPLAKNEKLKMDG